jgi:hypothetical protein
MLGSDGEPTTAKGNAIFDREPMPKPDQPKPDASPAALAFRGAQL